MAASPQDPAQLALVLLAHEKARFRAWKEKNRKALEVLLAPDYLEINSFGRFSKQEILASVLPSLSLHDCIISDPRFIVASSDAAILTYQCKEDLTFQGNRISGTFHVAAHYTRREKKWLLLLWQITPSPC